MTEGVAHRPSQGYRRLLAFQAAHDLVKATYEVTSSFPKSEQSGLTSQMRRAAVSAAANIVEGHAPNSTPLFLRRPATSFGSCKELGYYSGLSQELGYMEGEGIQRVKRLEGRAAYLINALIQGLKRRLSAGKVSEPRETAYSLDSLGSSDSGEARR